MVGIKNTVINGYMRVRAFEYSGSVLYYTFEIYTIFSYMKYVYKCFSYKITTFSTSTTLHYIILYSTLDIYLPDNNPQSKKKPVY